MKEVFANGRRQYPLFQGGDGIAINDLLNRLHADKHGVLAVGKIDNPDFRESPKQVVDQLIGFDVELNKANNERIEYRNKNSYRCILLKDELFEEDLQRILAEERPDIVLTQLNSSHRVIDIAHGQGAKVVLFVHDHHPFNYLTINASEKVSHVFFNSESTQGHFAHLLKCPSSVLYSPLVLDNYRCPSVDPRYITMVNPTEEKGAGILKEVIQAFPDQEFQLVSGWRGVPDEFHGFSNVRVIERKQDMKEVYSKTKILLVPSQWEEAFGRVAIEAMINRIPVVASRIGGLPEAVGNGGILVNDFVNAQAWIESLRLLMDDTTLYQQLGDNGYNHALKFDIENIYPEFISVLNRVHGM
jgi:glycosyltransferase involved in cell wall biosynthesis